MHAHAQKPKRFANFSKSFRALEQKRAWILAPQDFSLVIGWTKSKNKADWQTKLITRNVVTKINVLGSLHDPSKLANKENIRIYNHKLTWNINNWIQKCNKCSK